jgi:hypothetical protein
MRMDYQGTCNTGAARKEDGECERPHEWKSDGELIRLWWAAEWIHYEGKVSLHQVELPTCLSRDPGTRFTWVIFYIQFCPYPLISTEVKRKICTISHIHFHCSDVSTGRPQRWDNGLHAPLTCEFTAEGLPHYLKGSRSNNLTQNISGPLSTWTINTTSLHIQKYPQYVIEISVSLTAKVEGV